LTHLTHFTKKFDAFRKSIEIIKENKELKTKTIIKYIIIKTKETKKAGVCGKPAHEPLLFVISSSLNLLSYFNKFYG